MRAFHRDGEAASRLALERGLSGYFSKPQNRRAADRARVMLRNYITLSEADGRAAFDFDVAGELEIGADVLKVSVDLALLDPNGYCGRIMLWDQLACDREAAATIAGPAFRVLADELGPDRTDNIEVWHMPTRARYPFTSAEAAASFTRVARLLERIRPEA